MKEALIKQMKDVFGTDDRRINHALAVLKYAEQIHTVEGGDQTVITAAAILHDIGIRRAEERYGSVAGKYQEIEGPPIAAKILKQHCLPDEAIEHICRIIANHHSAKDIDTIEFRIIWDADWLVNIPDECGTMSKGNLKEFINKIFKTNKGREMAEKFYLNGE